MADYHSEAQYGRRELHSNSQYTLVDGVVESVVALVKLTLE